jgi:hypothetical protein
VAELNALRYLLDLTCGFAEMALSTPPQLTAIPPFAKDPFPYGDLVPLGFVLFALRIAAQRFQAEHPAGAADRLEAVLLSRRVRGLWAYQHGGLETSIDSGLVLLGMNAPGIVAELERFSDGHGSYVPQLFTNGVEPGKMSMRDSLSHWGCSDYSIACLVRGLRSRTGLPALTPLPLLTDGFNTRSGLYLANPYFPDWLLSLAIGNDAEAAHLRHKLSAEVQASVNVDGSFGKFDLLLSTALAVLCLQNTAGGAPSRSLDALRSLAFESAASIPFYSTETIAWSKSDPWLLIYLGTLGGMRHLVRARGQEHAITFYRDEAGMVACSLALAALASATETDAPAASTTCHPRYLCQQPEYIASYAVAPYVQLEAAA